MRRVVYDAKFVLEGAYSLAIRSGFHAITARGIAQELGISTQPVYAGFKSMEDVKEAVIKKIIDHVLLDYFRNVSSTADFFFNYYQFSKKESTLFASLNSDKEVVSIFHRALFNQFSKLAEVKNLVKEIDKKFLYCKSVHAVSGLVYLGEINLSKKELVRLSEEI